MNISTGTQTPTDTSAQTQQQANEVQPSANSDKVSNAQNCLLYTSDAADE